MSYDITIAAHRRPDKETLESWASDNGLEVVEASDGHSFTVQRAGRGEAGYVCEVWGPDPAEPEDFDEELAEACLSPRWMLQISLPYSVSKANLARARALARHLAETSEGAAFDPQQDRLLWPRGTQKRTPPRSGEAETSMLTLEWFIAPSRWRAAVDQIVPLIRRRCTEALPTRYGGWEPLPHRFDHSDPTPFVEFVAKSEEGDGFWFASRPSFGGSFMAPHADKYAGAEDERFRVGRIEVSFDGELIGADERWREAVVDLFLRGAEAFGAFFAAAQVEPGWVVTRNNRAFVQAASVGESEHFLRGHLWQGLPPVPVWLSWYGDPYRNLVRGSFGGAAADERETGIFVRLSDPPLPRRLLPSLSLPKALTYRERRAIEHPDGSREWVPAEPDDRAQVIPELHTKRT